MFWLSLAHASTFMPAKGSEIAGRVDNLYAFLLIASLISCVLVIGGLIVFAFKYRRQSGNANGAYISHNSFLEFLWSFIPFVIFMIVFGWGWWVYHDMRVPPKDAFEVQVYGQKWFWDFQYKSGRKSSKELFVPVNTPVKLVMTSRDVIHSFFIPGMRVKQDVLPGAYTAMWFKADKAGEFHVFCAEFCGDQHSAMLAKIHVLPMEQFEQWLMDDPYKGLSMAEVGQKVFGAKCSICHNTTSESKVGPGFAGLFGSQRTFQGGGETVADENYIRESILNPTAKVVAGFPPAMPPFIGQLSEEEMSGIIEYIKTLKK